MTRFASGTESSWVSQVATGCEVIGARASASAWRPDDRSASAACATGDWGSTQSRCWNSGLRGAGAEVWLQAVNIRAPASRIMIRIIPTALSAL